MAANGGNEMTYVVTIMQCGINDNGNNKRNIRRNEINVEMIGSHCNDVISNGLMTWPVMCVL